MPPKFTEKYTQSDFVAIAKIIKVYQNEGEEELYKADILIRDLYKGENLRSIYIEGRSDGKEGSSCSIFIPENTELIIYASKKDNNKLSFGSCSGYLILNQKGKNQEKKEKREIEMLTLLKARGIDYTNKIWFGKKMGFYDELKKFNGIQLNKSFALYEITFTSSLIIKYVEQVNGFGNDVDSEIAEMLEKSSWLSVDLKSQYNTIKDIVPEGSKILVGFYFYEAEGDYKCFVSEHDL